jgi:hypothetical protein
MPGFISDHPLARGLIRFDADGRLAEEWVQTDYRSLLEKPDAASS